MCKCPLAAQVIGGERCDHRLLPVPHSKKSTDQAVSLCPALLQRSMLLLLHSNKYCVAIVSYESFAGAASKVEKKKKLFGLLSRADLNNPFERGSAKFNPSYHSQLDCSGLA